MEAAIERMRDEWSRFWVELITATVFLFTVQWLLIARDVKWNRYGKLAVLLGSAWVGKQTGFVFLIQPMAAACATVAIYFVCLKAMRNKLACMKAALEARGDVKKESDQKETKKKK